jgi:hypothetical protein
LPFEIAEIAANFAKFSWHYTAAAAIAAMNLILY